MEPNNFTQLAIMWKRGARLARDPYHRRPSAPCCISVRSNCSGAGVLVTPTIGQGGPHHTSPLSRTGEKSELTVGAWRIAAGTAAAKGMLELAHGSPGLRK